MNRRTSMIVTAIAAIVGFGSAACSSSAPAAPAPQAAPATFAPPASPSSTPAGSPAVTAEGLIPKKVGERAGLTNPDSGTELVDFWITKIQVDPKCGPYGQREPGKHAVVVDFTVQTYKPDIPSDLDTIGATLNWGAFQTKGADGVTHTAEFGACADTKALPNTYTANSKYTGQIELSTDDKTGSLILVPLTPSNNGASGWVWPF